MEPALDPDTVLTLEAFADTIIPGCKRFDEDRAIAGVSPDGGAVAAGALELLQSPAGGLVEWLPALAQGLNAYARAMLGENADESVPPFIALSYSDRAALVRRLTTQDSRERQGWVNLAVFSNMAFDSAAHLHTAEALAAGHPGLRTMGFASPDPDGRWRFSEYSYCRQLAASHPATTSSGSPA
jgi:hypothetical protein